MRVTVQVRQTIGYARAIGKRLVLVGPRVMAATVASQAAVASLLGQSLTLYLLSLTIMLIKRPLTRR